MSDPTNDTLAGLEDLLPQARVIATIVGDIAVAPLVTAQIPPFLRCARPLFDAIDGQRTEDGQTTDSPDWVALLETHGERIIEALAIATGQPLAAIGRLPPDQTIAVLQAVLEENMDFFVRRLLPAANRVLAAILGRLNGMAGTTSSSASSPTATAAPTS